MSSFTFNYEPEHLRFGDRPIWVSATDGDTPTVQLPIRMLGMDAPELHYGGASEKNPGKYDAVIEKFLVTAGGDLDAGLKKHLVKRLNDKPCTRQIKAGQAAYNHFQNMVRERLDRGIGTNGRPLKPRRLFVMVSEEVFDRYGRLLAYVNASYTKKERESIPPTKRPTFNLQMVQEGHAISLLIYPNIPKPADLKLIQNAVKKARIGRKGMWAKPASALLPYEFRWIVDTIGGGRHGPDRFCADIITGNLFPPEQYYRVLPENRLFFYPEDVGEALGMGLRLVTG